MATLYIANCTSAVLDFQYRVPGDDLQMLRRVQMQRIGPGMQQRIHAEAPLAVLEAIVKQHERYGLIPVEEVPRTKGFIGICYSYDKPVDLERFQYAVDHNLGALHDVGDQRRLEQAAATQLAIDNTLQDAQRHDASLPRAQLRGVSVETYEDSDSPTFAEGVRVTRNPQGEEPARSRIRSVG